MTASRMPIDGLLLLDKPPGWTSHDAVARVRRLTGERRVGHAGTLDPLATGLLVLGLGQGTRVLAYLGDAGKAYRARIRLGVSTNTYDAEGEVTARATTAGVTADRVEAALAAFRGEIEQRPPLFSALKRDGRPLYRYARAGIELEVPPRRVRADTLTLLAFDPPDIELEIACSSGFYVRSLAHDLGQRLGCGAHLRALRRTRVGPFTVDGAATVEALERAAAGRTLPALLQPLDRALYALPAMLLDAAQEQATVQGRAFPLRQAQDKRGQLASAPSAESGELLYRAYAPDGMLAAILRVTENGIAQPVRVFPSGRRGPAAVDGALL
jgi:tRNA pseudouridine55 synthase